MAKHVSRARRLEEALAELGPAHEVVEELAQAAGELKGIDRDKVEGVVNTLSSVESSVQELHDELESWYDNLPESFQNGSKGEALQSAMEELDEITEGLRSAGGALPEATDETEFDEVAALIDEASMASVDFPGMYG